MFWQVKRRRRAPRMEFIDLGRQQSLLKEKIDNNMAAVLAHGRFIQGPEVQALEAQLSAFTGASYAMSCGSGTDALQLALMALACRPGDEIITTPFTFAATAEVILLLGLTPVFVDINPKTYQIDPEKIPEAISARTKAIITVSLYGQCSEMDAINGLAKKHDLVVIEDAAQSFGAIYKEKKSCNLSDIGCTSFFPSKPLGCYGDGGLVTTSNEELAQKIKMIRNHGQSKRYTHSVVGVNSRLDTLQAAILLAKMTIFEDEVRARAKIGERYTELLKDVVQIAEKVPHSTHVYAQYTIEVDNRDKVRENLQERGVPTAVHYPIGLHQQPVMEGRGFRQGQFPHTEMAAKRVISLPMHPYLTEVVQDEIVQKVRQSL